jgi:dTDP-glucose 4,6-dehydratase
MAGGQKIRLLVTGGLGFIGSNFIRMVLEETGHSVTNIDSLSYGSNPANLTGVDDPRYRFVKGDIGDAPTVRKLLSEADAVVNFAAETHVDRSIAEPWPFFRNNVGGVLTILEEMRKSKRDIKFIQVGTDESYGDISKGSFKEADPLTPSSPYSASKASADLFVMAYHRTHGIDACITRCTNNYGPYQFPEKLIPKVIIRAHRGLKVPIYGTGRNVRDWLYVEDHCSALQLVLEKGKPGSVYNISAGNEVNNLAIVRKILSLMKLRKDLIEFVEDRPGHDVRYSLDSSKIRRQLGWKPQADFREALARTIAWYLANESWWAPLADERALHPTPWRLKF